MLYCLCRIPLTLELQPKAKHTTRTSWLGCSHATLWGTRSLHGFADLVWTVCRRFSIVLMSYHSHHQDFIKFQSLWFFLTSSRKHSWHSWHQRCQVVIQRICWVLFIHASVFDTQNTRLTRSKRLVVRARRWEGHARYLLDSISIHLHIDITTFYATIMVYDCYIWLQSTLGTVYKSHCFRADVTLWIHDLSHHLWGSQLSQCAALGAFDVAISFGGRIWSVSPFIVWKISFQWAWKQLLSRWW